MAWVFETSGPCLSAHTWGGSEKHHRGFKTEQTLNLRFQNGVRRTQIHCYQTAGDRKPPHRCLWEQ